MKGMRAGTMESVNSMGGSQGHASRHSGISEFNETQRKNRETKAEVAIKFLECGE